MTETMIKQGIDAIAAVDTDIAIALPTFGYPEPRIRSEGLRTLFSIVVGQQLSTHSAAAIMKRANDLLPEMTPAQILSKSDQQLRDIGLSKQKISYVKGLAQSIEENDFNPDDLTELDDASAIKKITALKGFGPWSAEIYLMFSLQRQDIFPSGDLALLIALQKLKGLDEKPTPKEAQKIIEHWSPWRSAGSLFLWHYYHGAPT